MYEATIPQLLVSLFVTKKLLSSPVQSRLSGVCLGLAKLVHKSQEPERNMQMSNALDIGHSGLLDYRLHDVDLSQPRSLLAKCFADE